MTTTPTTTATTTTSSSSIPTFAIAIGDRLILWDPNNDQVISSVIVSENDNNTNDAATTTDTSAAIAVKERNHHPTMSGSTITNISWNHNENVVACCSTQQLPDEDENETASSGNNGIRSKIFLFSAQTCKLWGSIGMDKILGEQQQQDQQQDMQQHHNHNYHCVSVRFCKNSVYLCVGTGTSSDSTIIIWNLKREVEVRRFNLPPIIIATNTTTNGHQQVLQKDILQAAGMDPLDRLVYGLGSRQFGVFLVKEATMVGHYHLSPTSAASSAALSRQSSETFTCMDQVANGLKDNLVVLGSSTGIIRIFDTTRCANGEALQLVSEWQIPQSQAATATATATTGSSSSSSCILQVSFCPQPHHTSSNHHTSMTLLAILCRHTVYITVYSFQSSACIQLLSKKSFLNTTSPTSTSTPVVTTAVSSPANATCCSWNGKYVAVGFDNGQVQVWMWKPAGKKIKSRDAAVTTEEEDCDWTLVATFPSSSSSSSLQPQQPVQGLLLRHNDSKTNKKDLSSTTTHRSGIENTNPQQELPSASTSTSLAVSENKEQPTTVSAVLSNNDTTATTKKNDMSVQRHHVVASNDRRMTTTVSTDTNDLPRQPPPQPPHRAADYNSVSATATDSSSLFSNKSSALGRHRGATTASTTSTLTTTNVKATSTTTSIPPPPPTAGAAGVGSFNNDASDTNTIHTTTTAVVSVIQDLVRDEMDSLRFDMQTAFRNLHVDILTQFQAQSDEINRVMNQQAVALNQLALENRQLRAENQQLLLLSHQAQQQQQEGLQRQEQPQTLQNGKRHK